MSEQQAKTSTAPNLQLHLPDLLDAVGGVLGKVFVQAKKDAGKAMFKQLRQGKPKDLGKLHYGDQLTMPLQVSLDYSEFQGAGFNYDVFRFALNDLLRNMAITLRAEKPLNVLSGDNGVQLIVIPGVVAKGEQANVLMLGIGADVARCVDVKLMFMEPEQFLQAAE